MFVLKSYSDELCSIKMFKLLWNFKEEERRVNKVLGKLPPIINLSEIEN